MGRVPSAERFAAIAAERPRQQIPVCAAFAGTSRLFIVGAEGLSPEHGRQVLSEVAAGQHLVGGEAGAHYQDRKFALVWPSSSPDGFFFRFYQLDLASGTFLPNMECGNAAAACGAFAVAAGLCEPAADGILGENLGTGQRVRLVPTDASPGAACDWEVTFLQQDFSVEAIGLGEGVVEAPGYPAIGYHTLERGNAFVFAGIDPDWVGSDLAGLVEQDVRRAGGRVGDSDYRPKIVFYAVDPSPLDGPTWLRACCHYAGEQHRSIPGSAAMSMAGLLTLILPDSTPAPWTGGVRTYMVRHPSGILPVQAAWVREAEATRIHATRFHSPVRILFVGNIFVDMAQ